MKKICVTGGNGLLGVKLLAEASGKYALVSVDLQNGPLFEFEQMEYVRGDITQRETISNIIADVRPECVIHTAAFTYVDRCESEKESAWKVNVEGAGNVALACRSLNIKMIHLSSDYVFDGEDGPYDENAKPHPISYYGRTKWESEREVSRILDDIVIARTTVLYGYFPGVRPNFVTWMIDQLSSGKSVSVVNDQFGTPTLADDLARALLMLFEKDKRGVYNTVGSEWIGRFEFAKKIATVFDLNPDLIKETTSDHFHQPAPRPLNGGLKIDKIYRETGFLFSSVYDGLKIVKQQMAEKDSFYKKVNI
jgi:dTDP-4-dehydrorhamnose reductase